MSRVSRVRESALAAAWAERRYPLTGLLDSLGRRLHVVYPGRRWGGPGPDFQGAVIALEDGSLLRGDVEVHVRASGWAQHHHAGDPAYRNVILHVVTGADALVLDPRGAPLPTVVLAPVAISLPEILPCMSNAPDLLERLLAVGRARFRSKAARFEADLTVAPAGQVLWRGIAEALGYTQNTAAFAALADAVPWATARQRVRAQGEQAFAAHLLEVAGLQSALGASPSRGVVPALRPEQWQLGMVRPGNHPVRRCRGLAALAARWAIGSFSGPADAVLRSLENSDRRPPRPWASVLVSPWIGPDRARAIAINVLLPFASASGWQAAETLFESLPGEAPNRTVRHMANQLRLRIPLDSACLQQGLIGIYKATCETRACETCAVSHLAVGKALA